MDRVDLVRGLLELADLPDHMGNHPHLGKIEKTALSEIGRALVDEGEVGEIDAKVGDARRVTSVQGVPQVPMSSIAVHNRLQFVDCSLRRLANPLPGLLQAEHRGVRKGGAHLEKLVVVIMIIMIMVILMLIMETLMITTWRTPL